MTWKKNVIVSTTYLIIIYSLTVGYMFAEIADINPFIGLFILFSIVNILLGITTLNIKPLFAVIISMAITSISLYIAIFSSMYPLFSSDAYGIYTSIIVNGLTSVILWNVFYYMCYKVVLKKKTTN